MSLSSQITEEGSNGCHGRYAFHTDPGQGSYARILDFEFAQGGNVERYIIRRISINGRSREDPRSQPNQSSAHPENAAGFQTPVKMQNDK